MYDSDWFFDNGVWVGDSTSCFIGNAADVDEDDYDGPEYYGIFCEDGGDPYYMYFGNSVSTCETALAEGTMECSGDCERRRLSTKASKSPFKKPRRVLS